MFNINAILNGIFPLAGSVFSNTLGKAEFTRIVRETM